jgi:prevent-host-death family protein
MKTVPAGEFKQTCLRLLDEVAETGTAVLITKRGVPVAQLVPPPAVMPGGDWLGSLRGSARIEGDLVEPSVSPAEWESLR